MPHDLSGKELAEFLIKKYKEKKVDEDTLRVISNFAEYCNDADCDEVYQTLDDWRRGEDGP